MLADEPTARRLARTPIGDGTHVVVRLVVDVLVPTPDCNPFGLY